MMYLSNVIFTLAFGFSRFVAATLEEELRSTPQNYAELQNRAQNNGISIVYIDDTIEKTKRAYHRSDDDDLTKLLRDKGTQDWCESYCRYDSHKTITSTTTVRTTTTICSGGSFNGKSCQSTALTTVTSPTFNTITSTSTNVIQETTTTTAAETVQLSFTTTSTVGVTTTSTVTSTFTVTLPPDVTVVPRPRRHIQPPSYLNKYSPARISSACSKIFRPRPTKTVTLTTTISKTLSASVKTQTITLQPTSTITQTAQVTSTSTSTVTVTPTISSTATTFVTTTQTSTTTVTTSICAQETSGISTVVIQENSGHVATTPGTTRGDCCFACFNTLSCVVWAFDSSLCYMGIRSQLNPPITPRCPLGKGGIVLLTGGPNNQFGGPGPCAS